MAGQKEQSSGVISGKQAAASGGKEHNPKPFRQRGYNYGDEQSSALDMTNDWENSNNKAH